MLGRLEKLIISNNLHISLCVIESHEGGPPPLNFISQATTISKVNI